MKMLLLAGGGGGKLKKKISGDECKNEKNETKFKFHWGMGHNMKNIEVEVRMINYLDTKNMNISLVKSAK